MRLDCKIVLSIPFFFFQFTKGHQQITKDKKTEVQTELQDSKVGFWTLLARKLKLLLMEIVFKVGLDLLFVQRLEKLKRY